MIKETLENTENYDGFRNEMVNDLVDDELNQPSGTLRALLEDFVWHMFKDMDDEVLQQHYDGLMEAKKDDVDPVYPEGGQE
tara:strand:+ start:230 stop:472 length:243 start_codon:yes stop_codon:yes gene_type:complete